MIQGSMVALVTPMLSNNAIDWGAIETLIEFHMDNYTDAIIAVGTTGESATLSVKEHVDVIRRIVQVVNKRVPVIAGTGGNCTKETVDMTMEAKLIGADACLLVTPYYNKPTQEGLYQHFKHVAEEVSIPQILYNVPGRTAVDLLPETVERLSVLKNIIGIKEATGDVTRGKKLIDSCGSNFSVFSGDDSTAIELMLMGGKGNISVTANVSPRDMHDLCRFAMNGETEKARALQEKLQPLNKALFLESNPIPVKWALQKMKLIKSGIRLPLTLLSEKYCNTVLNSMLNAGVISSED